MDEPHEAPPEREAGSESDAGGDAPEDEVELAEVVDSDPETDIHGTADATLGGYFAEHDRPPAFEGEDGHPYTVAIEVERTADLREPYVGFLVFPRWATTGLGVVGHVETAILWRGRSAEGVREEAGHTPLLRVKELLDEAIGRETKMQGEVNEG